jgi:hypothetical protein
MAKKVIDPKWQPKALWTARRLAELSAEVNGLRKKVRAAETVVSKYREGPQTSFASRVPVGQAGKAVRPAPADTSQAFTTIPSPLNG